MSRAPTGQLDTLAKLIELHAQHGRPIKPSEVAEATGVNRKTVNAHFHSMKLRASPWVVWVEWAGAYEPSEAGRQVAQEAKP